MKETRHSTGFRIAGGIALAALLSGCAIFGHGDASLPADAPRVIGAERRDRDHERLIAAFGGEARAPQIQRLLSDVTNRLVMASDRPDESYQVTILNSPVVNAFALPNGRLYVTRGLLALANDTSEVAAVLSHEIAHVTLRHASQRNEMQARSTLIKRVTENVLNDAAEAAVVQDQARSSLASFSRSQELEADQTGVKVLARAGFDPYGAPRFLTALGRSGSSSKGDDFRAVDAIAELRDKSHYRVMTPDDLVAALVPADDPVVVFHPMCGGTPPDMAWKSLRLFERDVLPKAG